VKNIMNHTYARISVSRYGVGTKCIKRIGKGVDPFVIAQKKCWDNEISIPWARIKGSKKLKDYITDYYPIDDDGNIFVNENGLNMMNISMFMNHSTRPNMVALDTSSCFTKFKTLRAISVGEELTIDYMDYDFNKEDAEYIKNYYK